MESNYSTEYVQLMNRLEKQKRDFESLCDRETCPLCRQKLLINPRNEIENIIQRIEEIREKYQQEIKYNSEIQQRIIEVENNILKQKEMYYQQKKPVLKKIVKKTLKSIQNNTKITSMQKIIDIPQTEYHLWNYAMQRYLENDLELDSDSYPELFC